MNYILTCTMPTAMLPTELKSCADELLCLNRGECLNENNVAKCKCLVGFTGQYCEGMPL